MVGVVKQDHVAGSQVARGTRRDAAGRRELAPVLPPARPQERLQTELARDVEARARVDPERWAVELRAAPDRLQRALEVRADGVGTETCLHPVAVAVDAD